MGQKKVEKEEIEREEIEKEEIEKEEMGKKKMEQMRKWERGRIVVSGGLIAWAVVLSLVARVSQGFAQWYSVHLYSVWVETVGRFAGLVPFSVSEVLLYVLILGIFVTGVRLVIRGVRKRAGRREVYHWCLNLVLIAGILFFLYVVNCGINYHRVSFAEGAGIRVEEYSAEELKEVCQWLTEQVNSYSGQVERDGDGVMVLDVPLQENTVKAMEGLQEEYPQLKGYYPRPKGLMNSWILSIQNLTGIYLPFTIEANYNQEITDYNIPFTACHELSHLRGFMQEQEANFIAFLASSSYEEEAFRYSGYLMGWIQCMNVLYKIDYDAWEEVRSGLSTEVEPDLNANREFWARYDGAVAEVSNKVNDTYLKANGQADGVKSYNRMVDLIVACYIEGRF
ncbi:DUF3810 domain-containing protein [Bariatricus sp. SGI.154]|uniref:DUF3810 domain-containing protein n=1 Tax=Bariatricus sp. SGI.154 TaxID=3420549 RepID=UPI003CFD11DD